MTKLDKGLKSIVFFFSQKWYLTTSQVCFLFCSKFKLFANNEQTTNKFNYAYMQLHIITDVVLVRLVHLIYY